ncbi:uroporphyrinogen-III synthase [Ramlibacter sp. GCM10027632]
MLVTRPAQDAGRWVAALQAQGLPARALPLIEIAPPPDAAPLADARAALPGYAIAMFVSANAVQGLLGDRVAWPAGTRAWATGPGTRAALLAAGVPAAQVDAPAGDAAQFDSETLWQQVRGQATRGTRALVVRGGDAEGQATGRPWLAGQLADAGARVDTVVAYVRRMPAWDHAQRALAREAVRGAGWWLFSSSEAVGNLRQLLPGESFGAGRALCTHPRIAQAAQEAGFGVVAQTRPVVESVAGFLQSNA